MALNDSAEHIGCRLQKIQFVRGQHTAAASVGGEDTVRSVFSGNHDARTTHHFVFPEQSCFCEPLFSGQVFDYDGFAVRRR
jgi:hypothetical protein